MGWTEGGDPVEIPSTSPITEESLCHPLCQCDKCAPVQQVCVLVWLMEYPEYSTLGLCVVPWSKKPVL